jgi:hypothetical protein
MVNARKDAIVVCLEVGEIVDPSIRWVPIDPGQADVAFGVALDSLPPSGGTLHVLPGSAPYEFQATVDVDKPNVTIRFSAGPSTSANSFLTFPSTGGGLQLFRVLKPRFRCVGAYVKYSAAGVTSDNDRSFFLVSDVAGECDDATFVGCTFEVEQASPGLTNFSCIRSVGVNDAQPRRGLRVCESTFLIHIGVAQSQSWSGPDPLGVCGVRATNTAEVLVAKTVFRGNEQPPPRGTCGPMILLDNCPRSILCDLVFQVIQSVPSTGIAGSLVRVTTHGSQEGHRTVLGRFSFENVNALYAVELIDARSDVVAYANFGRLLGNCEAAITVSGAKSDGLVVAALNFHNVSAGSSTTTRMLDLQAIRNATVSGITFKPFDTHQVPLRIVNGACLNVQVEPEQSVAAP